MYLRRFLSLLLTLFLLSSILIVPAFAYQDTSLRYGMRGEEVKRMQQALIKLEYLSGTADGIFGVNTENAVRKFQKDNHLKVDGVAGPKTLALLYGSSPVPTKTPLPSPTAFPVVTPVPTPVSTSLFGGDYTSMKPGSSGKRVVLLQKALIRLGFLSGKADGKYGKKTEKAVLQFQKKYKLKADGIAGKKTLRKIESLYRADTPTPTPAPSPTATPAPTSAPTPTPGPQPTGEGGGVTPPQVSSIRLLHWFNDIKPTLRSKQKVTVYDPSSRRSWTLQIYSCGRHMDAEPLTAGDTAEMLKAFGGVNTWNQKGVYVRLPNGTWTIGSTHDMPHLSGSIHDNQFNGHLCVHFLRNMDECKKNDPNYGVANQETIRKLWKKLTGEEISF